MLLLLLSFQAYANNTALNQQELDKAIAVAGITYKQMGNTLTVMIEQSKALNAIPVLQKTGMVNPELTQADIHLLPVSLSASVVGIEFTAWIINAIYQNNTLIDPLHVAVFLSPGNSANHQSPVLCYTFEFNRDIYSRINWKNITATTLPNESLRFTLSDWCLKKETEELQLAGASS